MRPSRALSQVAGLPEHAMTLFGARNILTDQDFWEALSQDPAFLSNVPFRNDQEKKQVVEAMARHSVVVGTNMTRSPIIEHVPDVLIAALVLSLLVAVAAKPWRPPAPEPQPAVRVAAESGIPAFHVIGDKDVVAGSSSLSANPVAVAAVVGRYPTEPLARGAEVDPNRLIAFAAPDGARLTLLQVSFAADTSLLSLKAPQRIALAASSPGPPQAGIVVEDVYLLHIQPRSDGVAAVIGTSAENVQRLAPFLTSGKLVPLVSAR